MILNFKDSIDDFDKERYFPHELYVGNLGEMHALMPWFTEIFGENAFSIVGVDRHYQIDTEARWLGMYPCFHFKDDADRALAVLSR